MDAFQVGENLGIRDAKSLFLRMMRALSETDKKQFLAYVGKEWDPRRYSNHSNASTGHQRDASASSSDDANIPDVIQTIIFDIKARVPLDAILPSENIKVPEKGENADCDPVATVHVDAFLYADEEVDTLIDTGKLQTMYCANCGSKNTKPCVIISHSASYRTLEYIFLNLLPPLDGRTLLDIGSRLGAVLYSAYVHSTSARLIGVEMNAELCKLQKDIVRKYNMEDRIEVINKRIEDCPEVVATSDIIIINNAFEFYVSEAKHREIWQFLKAHVKRGTILVTRPEIEKTFKYLNTGIDLDDWVGRRYTREAEYRTEEDTANLDPESLDYPDIACYQVL